MAVSQQTPKISTPKPAATAASAITRVCGTAAKRTSIGASSTVAVQPTRSRRRGRQRSITRPAPPRPIDSADAIRPKNEHPSSNFATAAPRTLRPPLQHALMNANAITTTQSHVRELNSRQPSMISAVNELRCCAGPSSRMSRSVAAAATNVTGVERDRPTRPDCGDESRRSQGRRCSSSLAPGAGARSPPAPGRQEPSAGRCPARRGRRRRVGAGDELQRDEVPDARFVRQAGGRNAACAAAFTRFGRP